MRILKLLVFVLIMLCTYPAFGYIEKSGDVSGETWSAGTYLVTSSITVRNDSTLTIAAGAIVKIKPGAEFMVNGTETNKIVFTSFNDDSYGGYTNGDNATSPNPGDWFGIFLHGQSPARGIGNFSYCVMRYGSGYLSMSANVIFYYSESGYFTNSVSEYSG